MPKATLVTIATFSTAVAAAAAKAALEAAGVRAFLESAEFVATVWYMGGAVGNVRLQVAGDDVQAAREVLALTPTGDSAVPAHRCGDCGLSFAEDLEHCPACGWFLGAAQNTVVTSPVPHPACEEADSTPTPTGSLRSFRQRFLWLIRCWVALMVVSLAWGLCLLIASVYRDATR